MKQEAKQKRMVIRVELLSKLSRRTAMIADYKNTFFVSL